jgi:polar amino acid transport system substrate-binding protein
MRRNLFTFHLALCLFILILAYSSSTNAMNIQVCLNQEMQSTPTGVLSKQLMALVTRQLPDIQFEFIPLPWARCLKMAEDGKFEAILTGSYTPERDKSLAYPQKADGSLDASKRMFNLGFVLIRRTGSKVNWDGKHFSNLDGPLGAQFGYSIVEYLRKQQNVEVDDGSHTLQAGLKKLLSRRTSGFIVNPFNFERQQWDPEFNGKLEVVTGHMIQKKPYFLILSNQFYANHTDLAVKLWKAIEKSRNSSEFDRLYTKQLDELQTGLNITP